MAFALEELMPKQRMPLRTIKDVIRLKWHAQLSHEQIASTLKVSKGVVAKYVALASTGGLDWEMVQDWSKQRWRARCCLGLPPRSHSTHPELVREDLARRLGTDQAGARTFDHDAAPHRASA
jgi:hypothetical protein